MEIAETEWSVACTKVDLEGQPTPAIKNKFWVFLYNQCMIDILFSHCLFYYLLI